MEKLYKKDDNNNIRVWWMEIDGNRFRAHSGVLNGKIVTSGWKYAEPKNVGKVNATTAEEQAYLEVDARYVFQKYQGKYYETIEQAEKSEPQYFSPMLAKKYEDVKFDFPVYAQPKLDGVRCIATKDGLYSRNGKPLVATPHISEALEDFFNEYPDAVLDGELYTHKYKDNFDKLISLIRKSKPKPKDLIESEVVEYHIYDTASEGSFEDRFVKSKMIRDIIDLDNLGCLKLVETILCENQEELDKEYGDALEAGFEGQMLRDPLSGYEQKRSKSLLKRKEFQDKEFPLESIEEGVGNWAGYAKTCHIRLEDGTVQKAALRGTFSDNKTLLEEREQYTEVTVRFQNRTPDGKLRFPVVVAFYKGNRDL